MRIRMREKKTTHEGVRRQRRLFNTMADSHHSAASNKSEEKNLCLKKKRKKERVSFSVGVWGADTRSSYGPECVNALLP